VSRLLAGVMVKEDFFCFFFLFFFLLSLTTKQGEKMSESKYLTISRAFSALTDVSLHNIGRKVPLRAISKQLQKLYLAECAAVEKKKTTKSESPVADSDAPKRDRPPSANDDNKNGENKQKSVTPSSSVAVAPCGPADEPSPVYNSASSLAVVFSWGDKKVFLENPKKWGVAGLHLKYRDKDYGYVHFRCVGVDQYKIWKEGQSEPQNSFRSFKLAYVAVFGTNENGRARMLAYVRKVYKDVNEPEGEDELLGHLFLERNKKKNEEVEGPAKRRRTAALLLPTDFAFDEDVALIQMLQEACISGAAETSLLVASCVEFAFPETWIRFLIRSGMLPEKLRSRDCVELVERFGQLSVFLRLEILRVARSDPTGRLVDFSFLQQQKRNYIE
jgi:hypothetical protein